MMENLKYKLYHLFIFCLGKFMGALFFIYGIIKNPIKNISIWLVGLLAVMIYGNISMEIKGKDMFLMSVGLVSIITFISNFLEKQTIDIENKDNFYLGYNIKKLKLHNNFWLKRFNEMPVKLMFWTIAILPIIAICAELEYSSNVLSETFKIFSSHIKYVNSIWLAAFIVCAFYCTSLLIESVDLSRKNFSQSYLYKITNQFEKLKIKIEIEHDFEEIFNNIFNIKNMLGLENNYYSNVERVTNYIINRGNEVSANDSEVIEFYNIAFECEGNKIENLLNKGYKYTKCDTNKKIKCFIDSYLLRGIIKRLKLYYNIKWNTIIKLNVLPIEIVNIAIQDLSRLLRIETGLHKNEDYKNIFWGIYTENKFNLYNKDNVESNLCISKICAILEEKFKDIDFLNQLNDVYMMMDLFDVLNKIDTQIEDSGYLSSVYKIIFEYIIDNKNKDNEFVKLFYNQMENQDLPEYLIINRNEISKNILMSGDLISNEILEYLIDFMQLEDIIVILIFRLAYAERSNIAIMKLDEFKVWKSAINKLIVRKDIDDLKKTKFIDELCCEISKSHISHFMSEQFIKWMWSSLFEKFDENRYEEFIKLGEEGIRKNFSLDSYIILRLLLCNYSYMTLCVFEFKDENKKQIENELCSIKDILDIK